MSKAESKKNRRKTTTKPPIYEGDPNVFDVERILKSRRNGNQTEYFIKWLGYPESENLWINESDITPDAIEQFHLEERNRLEGSLVVLPPDTKTVSESVSAPDEDQNDESYAEENLQNLGCNLLLQSTTEDFRLFSICNFNCSNEDQSIEASIPLNNGISHIEEITEYKTM